MSEFKSDLKLLEQAVAALRKADKASTADDERLGLVRSAKSALEEIDLNAAKGRLKSLEDELRGRVEARLASRRQDLEAKAREVGLQYRRLSSKDKVGVFELAYANYKVQLFVGSERLMTIEEVDGTRIAERVVDEQRRLDEMLLPRDRFFRVLKSAMAMARVDGKAAADGKVKVRELFPYVAAARQLASDSFRKRPSAKAYVDYSVAMLAYELHKFGAHKEQGWTCDGERLSNQGPAMSTQQEAISLPDSAGNPVQVLWLWIA